MYTGRRFSVQGASIWRTGLIERGLTLSLTHLRCIEVFFKKIDRCALGAAAGMLAVCDAKHGRRSLNSDTTLIGKMRVKACIGDHASWRRVGSRH